MGRNTIHRFSCRGHQVEVIRDRANLPSISKFEPRLGVQLRYGLKFDGQITDWTDFVEATDDEASARSMVRMGLRRALELEPQDETETASSAA
jgi:hypothetical protein